MEIFASKKYDRALAKLLRKNPHYYDLVTKRLKLLKATPNHPLLRLHKLSNHDEYSISVDHSIRIIISIDKDQCYLLTIGTHDEVY